MLGIFTKFAFIILIILLMINIFAFEVFETTDTIVTFSDFLDKLEEAPIIKLDLSTSVDALQIDGDWGVFYFARQIINAFGFILGFLVWLVTLLINMLIIIGYLFYLLGLSSFSTFV